MYGIVIKRFNIQTIIIALLFTISLFNLIDIVKSKNKECKKKVSGGVTGKDFYSQESLIVYTKLFIVFVLMTAGVFLFTEYAENYKHDKYWATLYILLIAIGATAFFSFFLLLLPDNWGNRTLKLIVNICVSAVLLFTFIDRLLVSSYAMGCVIENTAFSAHIASTDEYKAEWEKAGSELEKAMGENTNEKVENGVDFQTLSSPLWHPLCDDTKNDTSNLANEQNDKTGSYCYTKDDIRDMLKLSENDQTIFNTCMKMYYGQHTLSYGLLTNPSFIRKNCAGKYGFIINVIIFVGGIIFLILDDKEKGLTKLGSLVGVKNYQETLSDV